MKQKAILVIALLALVLMMIAPVMAETLTGTLGGSVIDSRSYNSTYNLVGATSVDILGITNIENSIGTKGYVHFDVFGYPATYNAGAPAGIGNIPFELLNITQESVCARGTFGYQRSFDNLGIELAGFQWLEFDSWENVSYCVGSGLFHLNIDTTAVNIPTLSTSSETFPVSNGDMWFISGFGSASAGDHIRNVELITYAEYIATRPAGIGINGTVSKLSGGTLYASRAYVFNGTSGAVIGNNPAVDTNDLYFNLLDRPLKIGIQDPLGNWYNTSVLFATGIPTPVPTVTPTPTTTIPAGYVRNNLYVWDQNDAQISGADVDVLDVEAGTWTNATADPDGWITIDTLPYHTVNVYAHYPTANIYLPNEILGLETGYYGGHNWVLVLYPYTTTPSGFVTLYINTRNYDTKAVLTGVSLQIKNLVTGATTGESTGSTDSVTTVVTNATNYQITGSKSGYLSKTININSGEGPSKTVVVELSRSTVTTVPTSTIPPGGVTPVVTQDPNDPSLHGGDTSMKAQEMMNWLAMHGMDLVQLCFLVTIFALLGVKLGK
jgi:hypothetical protein